MGFTAYSTLFFGYVFPRQSAPWASPEFEHDFDMWLEETRSLDFAGRRALLKRFDVEHSTAGDLVHDYVEGQYECIYIAESLRKTYAGSIGNEPVDVGALTVGEQWSTALEAFCREIGFTPDKKPRWWLTAAYR